MGQRDLVTNKCLSDTERYSDLINAVIFAGEQKIHSEELQEVDSKSVISRWLYKYGYKSRQLYRDVVKKVAFGLNFAVVGVENQNEVHYLMPLRVMAYDVAEYEKQASRVRKRIRKRKDVTPAEYLSGFGKDNKLHPCVTIVLFYGEEWDGSTDLHELLDFTDIPKELTEQDPMFQKLDEEAYDMIAEYTNSSVLKNIKKYYMKGGKVDMCKGLRDWMEEEYSKGIEQGIKAFVEDRLEDGESEDAIVDRLVLRFTIKVEKAKEYYEMFS